MNWFFDEITNCALQFGRLILLGVIKRSISFSGVRSFMAILLLGLSDSVSIFMIYFLVLILDFTTHYRRILSAVH
jgi:hypothetical protein